MSQKKVDQLKQDRFFKIWDILIYGAIALIVAAVFLAVFLTGDNSALSAVEGQYNNEPVFYYDFSSDELTVYMEDNVEYAYSEDGNGLMITFCIDGGSLTLPSDYNIIFIDKSALSVAVTESDCFSRLDCVHTPAITDNSGVIVCTPHNFQIVPAGFSDIDGILPVG